MLRPGSKSSDGIAHSSLLHPGRPRVTGLSRKVLAGGTASALVLLFGAVLWALQNKSTRGHASEELYNIDHHNVADGLAGVSCRVRIPVKATMDSDAWRPLDPVDDDQGGA